MPINSELTGHNYDTRRVNLTPMRYDNKAINTCVIYYNSRELAYRHLERDEHFILCTTCNVQT